MKSVLGYLNPINMVSAKTKSKFQTLDQDKYYETVNFDIQNNEYIPQFDKFQGMIEEDSYEMGNLKIDEIEDIYLSHYELLNDMRQSESKLIEYIVQQDDTIYGLELKFQLSVNMILEMNQISENLIVPGIVLKLPWSNKLVKILQESRNDNIQIGHSYLGRNLMDEIMTKGQTKKYNVHYLTNPGNIQGTLTINQDIVLFDPNFNDFNKNLCNEIFYYIFDQEGQILKFQACICMNDILDVNQINLPIRIGSEGSKYFKDYIIEIILRRVGKKNKFQDKIKKQPGSIYFRIQSSGQDDTHDWEFQEQQCQEIYKIIQDQLQQEVNFLIIVKQNKKRKDSTDELIQSIDSDEDDEITFVPFFEINYQDKVQIKNLMMERLNKFYGETASMPKLVQQSSILSYDKFIQVLCNVPSVFRSGNWKMIYQNQQDGSSMNTLLTASENNSPQIIIIKDHDGYCFGAYLSDFLRLNSGSFFGTGETFLFTFQTQNNIEVYKWSNSNANQNQYFIYCDLDGIGIGCGDKYGIYINTDLIKGYSSKCDTFQNQILTQQGDYKIDLLELWCLDLY